MCCAAGAKRMAVLWSKLYQHRPGRPIEGKSDSVSTVAEQAKFLGHRYMSRKMRRLALAKGTTSLKQIQSFDCKPNEQTTLTICQLIETLELLYPETYGNISTNLHLSNFNTRTLCQDFATFSDALFRNGIRWPLILAFLAFSGALAEECTRHGRSNTILSILNWIQCFTALRLSPWIEERGGWVRWFIQ